VCTQKKKEEREKIAGYDGFRGKLGGYESEEKKKRGARSTLVLDRGGKRGGGSPFLYVADAKNKVEVSIRKGGELSCSFKKKKRG